MTPKAPSTTIQTEMQIRVVYSSEPGKLTKILKIVRESGGALRAHLVFRSYDRSSGYVLCEKPSEAALALEQQGFEVETETVVTVQIANRPGVFSYLVQTVEAEGIDIGYSYASASAGELLLILQTDENPKTEDVLRNLLFRPDPFFAEHPPLPSVDEASEG